MLVTLLGNVFPPLVSVLSGPILAQSLGVDGRGVVGAATAPFALVVAVVTLGVPDAVTFFVAKAPHLARNLLIRGSALLVASGVAAMSLVWAASPALADGDAEVRSLMLVASLAVVPNLLVGGLRGVAAASGRWTVVAGERALGSTLKLLILVPFWLTGTLTPLVATVVIAAVPLLGALPYLVMLRRLPARAGAVPDEFGYKPMMSYGFRSWAGSVSGILHARLDQVLVAPLSNATQMGLYVVAVAIGELPLIVHSAVRDVNFVAEASESRDERLGATARISTLLTGAVSIGVGVGLPWWLPLLFGRDFVDAVPATLVLLLAATISAPGSIAGSGLSGRGRPGLRSWTLALAAATNAGTIVLLVPTMGALGAAWATVVGQATQGVACIVLVNRLYGIPMREFFGVRRTDLVLLAALARRLTGPVLRRMSR